MTVEHEPDEYRAEHVRQALAADPRTGTLDVRIRLVGDRAFLSGHAPDEPSRTAIGDVVAGQLPGVAVHNEVVVPDLSEPTTPEVLS